MNYGDRTKVTGHEEYTVFYCSHHCGWYSPVYRSVPLMSMECPDHRSRGGYSPLDFVKFSKDEMPEAEKIVGWPLEMGESS